VATKKAPSKVRKGWKDIPLLGKIGAGIGIGYIAYKIISREIKDPPSKVKCNLKAIEPEMIEDLADLVSELYNSMRGTNIPMTGTTDRATAWKQLADYSTQNDQALCFMHNYWIKKIDEEESLHSWITDQVVLPWSLEEQERDRAILSLANAGLTKN